ncbi:MAG: N-methyl-L-tryptophan oxidase [Candidatus Baltobacteraceae bacterium]
MYDVVIAGLGGMGSSVAAHCASRGASVLGIDRFGRGHDFGSSSGKSRIIRQAYFENSAYVPLLLRAYELWRELDRSSPQRILEITGLLLAGYEGGRVIDGSRRAARDFNLSVDYLDAKDIVKRYPTLSMLPDEVGIFEREGGVVFPEAAIEAHLCKAQAHGARFAFGLALQSWDANRAGVTTVLSDGSRIESQSLVLTLGPWLATTLESLGVAMRIQRNVQVWFEPANATYAAGSFPAFFLERRELPRPLYGFPDFGDGVKAAFHGKGEFTQPDSLRREIDAAVDVKPLAGALERWMPGSTGPVKYAKACMYSLTPDEDFVVDLHPAHNNVVICGGFSGHGFKFASVIGEIAADLALSRSIPHDIAFLSTCRFSSVAKES